MDDPLLRIHPTIGLSRVGNSPEHYLAPESIAALPRPDDAGHATTGGLPIKPGTEADLIGDGDLRDAQGAMKRQAARFRIHHYPPEARGEYPSRGGQEITVGSTVEGRTVAEILWTVHVANKKAASFVSDDDHGVHAYEDGQTPVLRNLEEGLDPHNLQRLRRLVIDPGPRAISGHDDGPVAFDATSTPSHVVGGRIESLEAYPRSFPHMSFPRGVLDEPTGPIDTLGELRTDHAGRLVVTGGRGRAVSWRSSADAPAADLLGPVNNDYWFDDTSDGPVDATVVFDDGSTASVHGAWVITTDPSYAPQTLNVVSLWDEAYDSFVRHLDLDPRIHRDGRFVTDFRPSFDDHVRPFFVAAAQQRWNTFLPPLAIDAHRAVGEITADDEPSSTIMAGLAFIRRPDPADEHSWRSTSSQVGAPLMPLALGDSSKSGGKPFLTPTVLQYFLLEQWADGHYDEVNSAPLGFGEYLDRASLQNCLGGRFSPGIDFGFVVREPEMYVTEWAQGAGPFRIRHRPLDYRAVGDRPGGPFLTLGWLPRHPDVMHLGLEPGDLSKFLALPWHADYNSCAIHQTSPNDLDSQALYWSWPGQRPVTVYVAKDVEGDGQALPRQRYSVRGPGTMPRVNSPTDRADMSNAGRFWDYKQMLTDWHKIGTVVQGTVIEDGSYPDDVYLEVQSQLPDHDPDAPDQADPHPWPLIGGSGTARRRES